MLLNVFDNNLKFEQLSKTKVVKYVRLSDSFYSNIKLNHLFKYKVVKDV